MTPRKVLIFGNSGSGKSTLARQLAETEQVAHLDLDTLAWLPTEPPTRREKSSSGQELDNFVQSNERWVIEGGYTDLLELAEPSSTDIIFLDLPVDNCVKNARSRPWEPHKYESKNAQDQNLEMLIGWIRQYPTRDGVFSRKAHMNFYQRYSRKKQLITRNQESTDPSA